jgi:transcriptional regulator with XRE-family HTH domain
VGKRKFSDFMLELRNEARAEGPRAVEELDTFHEHFRLAREMAAARRREGLTQSQLAARTGINQSEISDIERGQANPTYRTLQALAQGVGYRLAFVRAPKRATSPARKVGTAHIASAKRAGSRQQDRAASKKPG